MIDFFVDQNSLIKKSMIDNYCRKIRKRSEKMQDNLNNFDKDIQKEKDDSKSL